jgi:hypothetical protein
MARPQKFKKEEVVDALQRAHGLKTGAAELLGVSFKAIDAYCGRYEECQAVVEHWRKRRKDRSEYKLDEAIERGESWAVMFTLKNARDREYSDRLTVVTDADIDAEVERVLEELASRRQAQIPSPPDSSNNAA